MKFDEIKPELLKRCPFCGWRFIRVHTAEPDNLHDKDRYYVVCGIMTTYYLSRKDAVEGWNRRVKE